MNTIIFIERPWRRSLRAVLLAMLAAGCIAVAACSPSDHVQNEDKTPENPLIRQTIDVMPVWSGHQVRFALLTHGQHQIVAFFDADRQMTVGLRRLDSTTWRFARLPLPSDELAAQPRERPPATRLAWDSHNSITLAVDRNDDIHLSGNMHASPLVYFRTERPMDIDTFRWRPQMTGERERKVTYPKFMTTPRGDLVFTYRGGRSGDGDQIFNRYDSAKKTWGRLFDEPFFSGEGKRNAYYTGPIRDRLGKYHLAWIWRDTPDCATNHDVCYAQSADLIHWTTSDGKPLTLPITLDTAEVVDPVASGSGLSNGDVQIGFDSQRRVILSYYRFDAQGNTQIYNARREAEGWRIYQTSDWSYRWDLRGTGSIQTEIQVGPVVMDRRSRLTQSYRHIRHGEGIWQLDEATLKPTGEADPAEQSRPMPPELDIVQSTEPNMKAVYAFDLGRPDEPGVRYILRWEARPPNRDRPYPGDPPHPSMLQVIKLVVP